MGYRCHDNMDAVFCWQHQLPSPFLTSADGSQGMAAEVEAASPASGTILLLLFFKPSKNEGRKKIEKVKKNGEANVPSGRPTQNYCATKQN